MKKFLALFNIKIILVYGGIWAILFFAGGHVFSNINDFLIFHFGGVKIEATVNHFNMMAFIRWTIAVLPPIIISLIYVERECSVYCVYTIMRYGSLNKWWRDRFCVVLVNQYIYLLMGMGLAAAIHFNAITKINISSFFFIILLFPLFTLIITLICITLFLIIKSQKAAIATCLILTGFITTLGLLNTNANKYSFGCFGMLVRSKYMNEQYGFSIPFAALIMLIIALFNIAFQLLYLKKHNPAGSKIY